jgi:hypothetical protein
MDLTEKMADFYNGAIVLDRLAAWAYVTANGQEVVDQLVRYRAVYEEYVGLHRAGKLDAGGAELSRDVLDRVDRIIELLRPGLDSSEARAAAKDVATLAESCARALKPPSPQP